MTNTADRRIYAACLASYNNGILHGRWIDCDGKDADDIQGEVNAMLKASRLPDAEEWAIHDYEGFPRGTVQEYTSFQSIAAMCEVLEAGHGVGLSYLLNSCGYSLENALERAEEVEVSEDETPRQYCERYMEETGGLEGVPAHLANYIDFDAMARDWVLSGDLVEHDSDEKGRVLITNSNEF
jgi:antirestriction protein